MCDSYNGCYICSCQSGAKLIVITITNYSSTGVSSEHIACTMSLSHKFIVIEAATPAITSYAV